MEKLFDYFRIYKISLSLDNNFANQIVFKQWMVVNQKIFENLFTLLYENISLQISVEIKGDMFL